MAKTRGCLWSQSSGQAVQVLEHYSTRAPRGAVGHRMARSPGRVTDFLRALQVQQLNSLLPGESCPCRSVDKESAMPKYVIERDLPGAGKLSPQELKAISQKSCGVLSTLGPQIQWVQSYVTGDKVYCVYIAPNEEMVREHARQGGFPANRISEVASVIDPTTAE